MLKITDPNLIRAQAAVTELEHQRTTMSTRAVEIAMEASVRLAQAQAENEKLHLTIKAMQEKLGQVPRDDDPQPDIRVQ